GRGPPRAAHHALIAGSSCAGEGPGHSTFLRAGGGGWVAAGPSVVQASSDAGVEDEAHDAIELDVHTRGPAADRRGVSPARVRAPGGSGRSRRGGPTPRGRGAATALVSVLALGVLASSGLASAKGSTPHTYTVRAGDTLTRIAGRFGV